MNNGSSAVDATDPAIYKTENKGIGPKIQRKHLNNWILNEIAHFKIEFGDLKTDHTQDCISHFTHNNHHSTPSHHKLRWNV